MLEPGQQVDGRYVIEAEIGEGGLAKVYRVRHLELGSIYALKVLLIRKRSLADRLLLEGRIQAQLKHPNVVAVLDVIRHDGQFGLLMEYVDHLSLEELIQRRGRVSVEVALDLFAPVLAGVHAAHRAGVLHRDLKPSNVLLARTTAGLVPKVSDFGIAKVVADGLDGSTREGVAMGTPGYMAPEQVLDARSVDARTDIFALGSILYELLTGQRAFADETGNVSVRSTVNGTVRPIDDLVEGVPAEVSAAVERSMAKSRDDRFESVAAFARAVLVDRPALVALFEDDAIEGAVPLSLDPGSLVTTGDALSGTGEGARARGGSPSPAPVEAAVHGKGPTLAPEPSQQTYTGDEPASPTSRKGGSVLVIGLLAALVGGLAVVAIVALIFGPVFGLQGGAVDRPGPEGAPGDGVAASQGASPRAADDRVRAPSAGEPGRASEDAGSSSSEPMVRDEEAEARRGADSRGTSDVTAVDPGPSVDPVRAAEPDPIAEAGQADAASADEDPASGAGSPDEADEPDAAAGSTPGGRDPDGEDRAVDEPLGEPGSATGDDLGTAAGSAAPDESASTDSEGTSSGTDGDEPVEQEPAATVPAWLIGASFEGRLFRQPFTLRIVKERAGEVSAEGRVVQGVSQRLIVLAGTYDPSSGVLDLREVNGDLRLQGVATAQGLRGTYRRKDRGDPELLDLSRR